MAWWGQEPSHPFSTQREVAGRGQEGAWGARLNVPRRQGGHSLCARGLCAQAGIQCAAPARVAAAQGERDHARLSAPHAGSSLHKSATRVLWGHFIMHSWACQLAGAMAMAFKPMVTHEAMSHGTAGFRGSQAAYAFKGN